MACTKNIFCLNVGMHRAFVKMQSHIFPTVSIIVIWALPPFKAILLVWLLSTSSMQWFSGLRLLLKVRNLDSLVITCVVEPQSTSKQFLLEMVSSPTENRNECSLFETCFTFFMKCALLFVPALGTFMSRFAKTVADNIFVWLIGIMFWGGIIYWVILKFTLAIRAFMSNFTTIKTGRNISLWLWTWNLVSHYGIFTVILLNHLFSFFKAS